MRSGCLAQKLDDSKWLDCPVGITAREKKEDPPRTSWQEVQTGDESQRVFVIDSDERRAYEQGKRTQAMERKRASSSRACGTARRRRVGRSAQIGAAAERALQAHNGYRYFTWDIKDGIFAFTEHPLHFEREKRLEGRYVIATSEKTFTSLDAVAMYKQLTEVERGFRRMKDVLSLRPIYHRVEPRVRPMFSWPHLASVADAVAAAPGGSRGRTVG